MVINLSRSKRFCEKKMQWRGGWKKFRSLINCFILRRKNGENEREKEKRKIARAKERRAIFILGINFMNPFSGKIIKFQTNRFSRKKSGNKHFDRNKWSNIKFLKKESLFLIFLTFLWKRLDFSLIHSVS